MELLHEFQHILEEQHSALGLLDIKHLKRIENELNQHQLTHRHSRTHNDFITGYFEFARLASQRSLKTLCIIATPSPFFVIQVASAERIYELTVPPIYGDRDVILGKIKRVTKTLFTQNGYKTIPVVLPKKVLAVYSGLAQYGNNGLAYVKNLGSYHRLTAFATDYPCPSSVWNELAMMRSCRSCGKCVQHCPSGALEAHTPWVNVNRCLTAFNERPGAFPEWIDAAWHTCLVGCTICQDMCPRNSAPKKEQRISLQQADVDLMMKTDTLDDLPDHLRETLKRLNLDRYYQCLQRNIAVLVEAM